MSIENHDPPSPTISAFIFNPQLGQLSNKIIYCLKTDLKEQLGHSPKKTFIINGLDINFFELVLFVSLSTVNSAT
jgi:hypothetical protein